MPKKLILILVLGLLATQIQKQFEKHDSADSMQLSSESIPGAQLSFEENWLRALQIEMQKIPSLAARVKYLEEAKIKLSLDIDQFADRLQQKGISDDQLIENPSYLRMVTFDSKVRFVLFNEHSSCTNSVDSVNTSFPAEGNSQSENPEGAVTKRIYKIICTGAQ